MATSQAIYIFNMKQIYRPSPVCLSEGTECESEGLHTLLPKLKLEAISGR